MWDRGFGIWGGKDSSSAFGMPGQRLVVGQWSLVVLTGWRCSDTVQDGFDDLRIDAMSNEERAPAHHFVTQLRVRTYEMDVFGHVNNAVYLHYLEQVAWEHSEYLGVTLKDYDQLGSIFILRKMEIEYLRPAAAGDTLELSTWAHELRGARAIRKYEIVHAESGTLLAQATGLWAWVDRATGRPRPIPAFITERFTRPARADAGWQER